MFLSERIFSIPRSKRFVVLLALLLGVIVILTVTRLAAPIQPYTAELSYQEVSIDDDLLGAVVPASCESNPPTSHFSGDCQCSISAPPTCSAPGCTKTVTWNTNVGAGVNVWVGGTHMGSFARQGNLSASIPAGGTTLSVRRADGTVLCSSFTSGYPPPIVTLTSSHAVVPFGVNPTLTWTTSNSAGCTASGAWSGSKTASGGAETVAPIGLSNTYTITCYGPGGSSASSVTVSALPPTVDLTVSTPSVVYGSSANLSWTTSNVGSCTASGEWSGSKSIADDSETVTPMNGTNTYTLTCVGVAGVTAADTVVVTMLPPNVAFWSDPGLIGPGQSSSLRWIVGGAAGCNVPVPVLGWTDAVLTTAGMFGGSTVVSPRYVPVSEYQLRCTNPAGTTLTIATITQPSGWINATSCVIPFGMGSCNSVVSWDSANFLGGRSVSQDGTQFSTAASNSGVLRSVNPENDTFRIDDTGSSFYREDQAMVTCQTGSVWVSAIQLCTELPVISIVPASDLIRSDSAAVVDIGVKADYDANCTMSDGVIQPFSHSGNAPQPKNYGLTTRNLTAKQVVSVTCTHVQYPEVTSTAETTIEIIPTVQEI